MRYKGISGKWHNLASYQQTVRDYRRALEDGAYHKAANIYLANPPIQTVLAKIHKGIPDYNPHSIIVGQAA